jgi:hypothetical protein
MNNMKRWSSAAFIALAFGSGAACANGIASATFEGDGCPGGSVGISISADRQVMTLIFDEFIATVGPGIPASEADQDCRVVIAMQTDESVDMSVQSRGFVQLPFGMSAHQQQHVPRAKSSNLVTQFSAPVSRDYFSASSAKVLAQGKSSSPVTIQLRIGIDEGSNTTGMGQITVDSVDVKLH